VGNRSIVDVPASTNIGGAVGPVHTGHGAGAWGGGGAGIDGGPGGHMPWMFR